MAYSKTEQKTIRLGYLWHWGSIGAIVLLPFLSAGIAKLFGAIPEIQGFLFLFAFGITFLSSGTYQTIGTALEWKHILIALQINPRHSASVSGPNPQKPWTKAVKRKGIALGIIDLVVGTATLIVSFIAIYST